MTNGALSLLSSDTPRPHTRPHDYILDSGVNVSVANTKEDLENAKSIQPVRVSGINGGVTTTQSSTHRLFGERLRP